MFPTRTIAPTRLPPTSVQPLPSQSPTNGSDIPRTTPTWAYFVGLHFVQILADFESLLPASLVTEMILSTYLAARNLMTRVGTMEIILSLHTRNPAIGTSEHRLMSRE